MESPQVERDRIRQMSRPRILLDTNVWRYLIDLDALEVVYRAAKGAPGRILACPAVLYEMLRTEDALLRQRLVKAICRSRWTRMMPEAFEESMELRNEITRLRPHWLLSNPDRSSFRKLYNDWKDPSGVWWRARTDPAKASAVLRLVEDDHLDRGRNQAYKLRDEIGKMATFDTVTLDRWTSTFPLNPGGWNGKPVETWRAETMAYYIDVLLRQSINQSPAPREWLEPWINISLIRRGIPSFARLFLYETDTSRLPRSWLHWAIRTLQATRRTGPGTPVDNQIGSYLLDADLFVTADKVFVAIVRRVADEAVVRIATPFIVTIDNCVAALTELLRTDQ